MLPTSSDLELKDLSRRLKEQAIELGFQDCRITFPDASAEEKRLKSWLDKNYQGEMGYLENHFEKRIDPTQLVPGTERIILVRMDYLPANTKIVSVLKQPSKAYIARYTLGRDYHRLIRSRLKKLGLWLSEHSEAKTQFRPFVDSAPVLERPLAKQAGLGWIGKNTLLLSRKAGSWFFLGSLFTDLPLPIDEPETDEHCGRCTACLDICPTQAFPEPWVLDARRCISYLTIEHRGAIDEELREKMGNRIFGCDDCQLICPWNSFASTSKESDFQPRHQLDDSDLVDLFLWDEASFLKNTEGSAIRRTGYQGWLRNIAIALGNSKGGKRVIDALNMRRMDSSSSEMVVEHIEWALNRLQTGEEPQPLLMLSHPGAKRLPE